MDNTKKENLQKKPLANSHFTQEYIFQDETVYIEIPGQTIVEKPNEVTMLKSNNIPEELKERLGMVMVKLNDSIISSDNPNRYRQSLSERQADAQSSLDDIETLKIYADEEMKNLEEKETNLPDDNSSTNS